MFLLDLNLPPSDSGISPATAAILWRKFGYTPIPTLPGKKYSPVTWNAWSADLDEAKIQQHYAAHPDHEVACLTNDELIVFDADSEDSLKALESIEQKHGIKPMLIVKTPRGFHHHFRRAGAIATQDAHDSTQHPDRIDIRTGRSMIVMPPSGGRSVLMCEATCLEDLSIATQEFIDDIFIHNGRQAPSAVSDEPDEEKRSYSRISLAQLTKLVHLLDADMGYQDWLNVGMAVFHETGGSSEGLSLFDSWSSGGKKYCGAKEIEVKWKSFRGKCSNPITVGTLVMLARKNASEADVHSALDEPFEACESEVIEPEASKVEPSKGSNPTTPFLPFSITGKSNEIQKNAQDEKFVLEDIALRGQSTVIYAAPNTGKTLITLSSLAQTIKNKQIDPSLVYYINLDDSLNGLLEKLKIAEEYGFHMLAEGYENFSSSKFMELVIDAMEQKCASGMVLILDTLKKFTNLMDKNLSSNFTKLCRKFVLQGGTIIALAHTNKNRGANGSLVPSGTSDITDDFDCAFVIDFISDRSGDTVSVEFENRKRRGNVASKVQFRYKNNIEKLSYRTIFDSVEKLTKEMATEIRLKAEREKDASIIDAIKECIQDGKAKKMEILKEVSIQTGKPRAKVDDVIQKYCGDDPQLHIWTSVNGPRGAHIFSLLGRDPKEDIVSI